MLVQVLSVPPPFVMKLYSLAREGVTMDCFRVCSFQMNGTIYTWALLSVYVNIIKVGDNNGSKITGRFEHGI
jgi:hypothetical protein